MSIPPPRRALTPTTGVLTGAPVIGKIDGMRIGFPQHGYVLIQYLSLHWPVESGWVKPDGTVHKN
jgi:hypothetical protein